jgi:hypothetical protein
MFRSTVMFLALALTVAHAGQAQTDRSAPPMAEPLSYSSGQGAIVLTTAVAGPDLSLTFAFAKPVKSYLNKEDPYLSVELELDTDNNPKTGWAQVDDRVL